MTAPPFPIPHNVSLRHESVIREEKMLCEYCTRLDFVHVSLLPQSSLENIQASQFWTLHETDETPPTAIYLHLHYSTLYDLKGSCDDGCRFCAMLLSSLVHVENPFGGRDDSGTWLPEEHVSQQVILVLAGAYEDNIENGLWKQGTGIRVWCAERSSLLRMAHLDDVYIHYSNEGAEDSTTGSLDNMSLAKIWLEECLSSHPECSKSRASTGTPLPTRVIDVGSHDTTQDLRLFVDGGQSINIPYIALSHCWGAQQIITTTKATATLHQSRIEWGKLSKTFQEAVQITRYLNVRYLWIDSLCIIQDSFEDWEAESAVMGDIYRRAMLTISANKAKDGNEGCFAQRDSRVNRPCRLSIHIHQQPQSRSREEQKSVTSPEPFVHVSPFIWPYPKGPLDQRAWTYQEQALSPRILSFGDKNMFWTCESKSANENIPMGNQSKPNLAASEFRRNIRSDEEPIVDDEEEEVDAREVCESDEFSSTVSGHEDALSDHVERDFESDEEFYSDEDRIQSKEGWYNLWYDMVAEYSRRSLTKETDRFPALSGLAAYIEKMTNSKYVAGLWSDDILRGLLWVPIPGGIRNRPPMEYIAPSWSWGSVTGCLLSYENMKHVVSYNDFVEEGPEVRAMGRLLKGKNSFGEVTHAMIRLEGRLLPARFSYDVEDAATSGEIFGQACNEETLYTLDTRTAIGHLHADERERLCATIWLLAMVIREEDEHLGSHMICLALMKIGHPKLNEYRRVGITGIIPSYFDAVKRTELYIV